MFIGCVLFAASAQAATAKTSGAQASSRSVLTTHELVLRDGSRMYGAIEREDDVEVVFRTQAGALVTVRRADIASLGKITGAILNGEFLPASPNGTRLFFAPTGPFPEEGAEIARCVPDGGAVLSVWGDRPVLHRRRHAPALRHRRIGTAVLGHAQASGVRDAVDPGGRRRPPRLQHEQQRRRHRVCRRHARQRAWLGHGWRRLGLRIRPGASPASSWWAASGPCAATSS